MIEPVLTTEAMQNADRQAIQEYGIPGFTLMETAGRAAYRAMADRYDPIEHRTVTILAGKGNNGGDGMVVARLLCTHGAQTRLILLGDIDDVREDPGRNLRLLKQLAETNEGKLTIESFEGMYTLQQHRSSDLFVDAMLGTGLTKELRSPVLEIVQWLNDRSAPVVALDVPTGLNSDQGIVHGAAVNADLTVTMAARKTGLLINDGPTHTGRTVVAEIGIPNFILQEHCTDGDGCAFVASDRAVQEWLPGRHPQDHKYSVGMVVTLGGSPGLTGAPVMASQAAARSGAGAVVCACPRSVQPILAQKMTEVMTLGLPETDGGGIATDALERSTLRRRIEKAKALLVGCGLGRDSETQKVVHDLVRQTNQPMVIDADGLNALVDHTNLLSEHADRQVILTPHAGEFLRLVDAEIDLTDRVRLAVEYARRWNSILLLKGMPGIVASPSGRAFINTTGNPALASAGTGDVLAGLCAGLAAQGLRPLRAAVAALRIGGAAADAFVQSYDGRTLLATDVIAQLPTVLHDRFLSTSP